MKKVKIIFITITIILISLWAFSGAWVLTVESQNNSNNYNYSVTDIIESPVATVVIEDESQSEEDSFITNRDTGAYSPKTGEDGIDSIFYMIIVLDVGAIILVIYNLTEKK